MHLLITNRTNDYRVFSQASVQTHSVSPNRQPNVCITRVIVCSLENRIVREPEGKKLERDRRTERT